MRSLPVALLLFVAALAPVARGTTIQLKSLPEMVAHADQVVQGRVINARAVEVDGLIYTEYQVEVSDWLKPASPGQSRTLVIRQLGGIIGTQGMAAPGIPHFELGQEVVLFTKDYAGNGHVQVANASQGALDITEEPPGRSGQAPGRRLRGARTFVGGAPDSLADFKAAVRAMVGEVGR